MSVYARIFLLIAGYAVTLLLIRWVILSRKRQPVAAVAWILAIIFIPIFGGILFLLIGMTNIQRRREGKLAAARRLAPKYHHAIYDFRLHAGLVRQDAVDRLATMAVTESAQPGTIAHDG